MEMNKEINTNVGILIFLVTATLLILIDFLIINNELEGKSPTVNNNNIQTIEKQDNQMTNEQALELGNELYEKASKLLFHPEYEVLTDENGEIKYIKNNDEFTVTDDRTIDIYFKITSGIEQYKKIFSNNFFSTLFAINENEYYSNITPNGGRGENIYHIDTELSIVSINDDEIIFKANSYYYINDDEMLNMTPKEQAQTETVTKTFVLIKENETWKVDEITLAY